MRMSGAKSKTSCTFSNVELSGMAVTSVTLCRGLFESYFC